eukprot:GGOE01013972.1.p1 GENE.GGOE01013972.1~~GGOE01013972.1.p1  ORF type:complete len:176 (-),score=42.44 GGOE01013972.1:168-695(-)
MARAVQALLDFLVPQIAFRWLIACLLLATYAARIYMARGFYIITYGLGIFLLNNFIQFISPQSDPDFEGDDDDMLLPTRETDEFRPFVRKLPEYRFWLSACKGICVAVCLTSSRVFDVPVYWPILLFYFMLLFILCMKKRIEHMIRHRYIPITLSKPKVQPRDLTNGMKMGKAAD